MRTLDHTEKKVLDYITENHMLDTGDKVVIGVSGGADSVCLLFVLCHLQDLLGFSLDVVHVNHGIRQEAVEDGRYVERLCGELGLPFTLKEDDVPALAREWGVSEEEAGRKVRYQAFEQRRREIGADKIAVAHHAGDQAETVLFHLLRGSGITGLCGIRPVNGILVRPLLFLERPEIEAYLQRQGAAYQTDATNASDAYVRNRIRHHMIEYAEREIMPGCTRSIFRAAELLAETERYLEEQTARARERCVRPAAFSEAADGYCLDVQAFCGEHPAIGRRLLLALCQELSPNHQDIGAVHVRALMDLALGRGNREAVLPYGIRGRRSYDVLRLERQAVKSPEEKEGQTWKRVDIPPGELLQGARCVVLPGVGELMFQLLSPEEMSDRLPDMRKKIPQKQYTKWFDYDKIKALLSLRTRETGDFITIRGPGGLIHKKVKDYLLGEKVPREQRAQVPLLAEGSHVIWILGRRISEYYKVSENSKHILQVRLFPEGDGSALSVVSSGEGAE